jgi:hypothetical protein
MSAFRPLPSAPVDRTLFPASCADLRSYSTPEDSRFVVAPDLLFGGDVCVEADDVNGACGMGAFERAWMCCAAV